MKSIIDCLEHWAAVQPDKCFSGFLDADGNTTESYTYRDFSERTRRVAQHLSEDAGVRRGDRVLLGYPPGLEVIVAFVACARVGAIPVPVPLPTRANFEAGTRRVALVASDCEARVALTTSAGSHGDTRSPRLDWISTDQIHGQASEDFRDDPHPVLFLQYTSGSTSDPRGVVVSHDNVLHNCRATMDHSRAQDGLAGYEDEVGVSWLPHYHDMGLIGYCLYPMIVGGTTYTLSPATFLRRPIAWLQAMTRFHATYASAPNFGFEYCLREDKIPSDQLQYLDLSHMRVLMNASEPVQPETYSRFIERFARRGLRPDAYVVAYGLAENTLAATLGGRRRLTVNKRLLQENTLRLERIEPATDEHLQLMSCGTPLSGVQVRIVDPQSGANLGDHHVGEVWLGGQSTTLGYWNRRTLTNETFRNQLTNAAHDNTRYLRTGDLGFLDEGELFVCGRIKDVIVDRGVNYYPLDIERIVESASSKIRTGGVAAFTGDPGQTLVVVAELESRDDIPDANEIADAIRSQYYIVPHTIAFVPPRTIARTTSGKISRAATRQRWLNADLHPVSVHVITSETAAPQDSPLQLIERIRTLVESLATARSDETLLADLGIDSLTLVTLVSEIGQLMTDSAATELVDQIDGPFLQRLTLAELRSLLSSLDDASNTPRTMLVPALTRLRDERTQKERERMSQDARLEVVHRLDSARCESVDGVLLTGPTGFFGPFLLASLLRQTRHTYYALTRASDGMSGLERIRDGLRRAGLLSPALEGDLQTRVRVVCGDIAKPNLGLDMEQWNTLAVAVQAVIHNAALVNYVANYDRLRPHNVAGTRELLRLACQGTRKEFHFISSTIMFGWTSAGELLETDNNESMSNLDFGYAQTKWVAEQLVLSAARTGLDVCIYRPAFLSASSAGIGSSDDIAMRLLSFMINHGVAVNSSNQISLLPVDVAAQNIGAIFSSGRICDRTLHVTSDEYYNIIDITRTITRDYGYQFQYYDIPSFVAQMHRRCTIEEPLYPLLDFVARSHLKIAAMQHKRYNNDAYRRAKLRSRDARADPGLAETVAYLMLHMHSAGLLRLNGASG